jgi:hypothetical protein
MQHQVDLLEQRAAAPLDGDVAQSEHRRSLPVRAGCPKRPGFATFRAE